ncbi:MAG: hypothetical protein IPK72_19955 [Candidatus Eisenbacteria bacterium]|nr:hypothetical protein [Candidatus Eisenbacteria bacterium]
MSAVNHERIESRSALIHPPVGRVVLSVCAALLLGGLALSLSTSLAQAEVTFVKPKGGSSSSGTSGSGSPAGGGPGGQSGGRLSGIRSAGNPAGPSVITIEDIRKQGLRRGLFVLSEETPLHVRAEGLSDPDGDVFLSYGYILDMKTRRPVWSMTDSDCCYDKKAENWRAEEEVTLPPGTYGVYYVAYGGKMPMKGKFKIFGLDLGEIDSDFGPTVEWDDEGDPERWGIWVTAMRTDFKPTPVSTALDQPFPDAVVNLLGVGNSTRKRVGLKLDRAVRFHLWATGEWWEGADDFADGASIIDQKSWRRIWQLERDNTVAAGGASKNRLFDDEITLPAGNYMVNVFTDDSHATDTWNTAPPWDPAAWGLAPHSGQPGRPQCLPRGEERGRRERAPGHRPRGRQRHDLQAVRGEEAHRDRGARAGREGGRHLGRLRMDRGSEEPGADLGDGHHRDLPGRRRGEEP